MATPAATRADHKLQLKEFLDWLVEDGVLDAETATKVQNDARLARGSQRHPIVVVGESRLRSKKPPSPFITPETLTEWLAARLKIPAYRIDPLKIDLKAVTQVMSSDYAQKRGILPVEVSGKDVTIATSEPLMTAWEAELAQMLRLNIKRVLASPIDIERYQGEFYNLARSVKRAEAAGVQSSGITNFEQLVELGKAGRQLDANDHHIVHLVDWLWQYAFDQRASDIHLEPRRDVGLIRFRIDGVLHQVYQVPFSVMIAMTSRIKILGRMDVVEKRRPQDGRIKTRTPDGDEVELRLSTMPTAFGEKLVMRVFNPDVLVKDFRELGFSDEDKQRWMDLTARPHGIILVTGPTGSGKTTTLYSTLKHLATADVNVCTIEDPIEMVEPQFNQMQVQTAIGLDFASGVRTLMRQDPDIVMVGEIRDGETAQMAVQAALTGHLVLSTLHTNDAPSAITRLLDIGVEPFLLHSTILGVLAQRLVRTLCPHCRESTTVDEATWQSLAYPWRIPVPASVQTGRGCLECRMTGYRGRIGIYEMMVMSATLRPLVRSETDLSALREQALRDGMKPLRTSGALKVAAGLTSVEEVLKVAPPVHLERSTG